ncbi:aromatic ring-hydroxylating dioxygenase subunit alpha [Pseudomonas sp. R5(2019)]|uniref:aromatic ring-hydroxylating oxygenase subunit alpha n=1 Tax=Pseudomonas sp. R5(2019) TaxID=2697566 RepID=UPI001412EB1F|nr:aromatic ring-hydroxylating dioxygenase subunit alpha [Pseudomonas sp. R5(2019)]NBA98379.1 Rieske 2Fe-2S domain-containing protein [Pseudomonas sp. R5(2019)]
MTEKMTQRQRAEAAMRRQWFPVARSVDLATPQSATLLGERLVVYRTESGQAVVQDARCPHRGADFALGKVHGESIACPYHGWRFDAEDGKCSHVPSLADQCKIPPQASIKTYPVIERFAHVWTVLEDPVQALYDPEQWKGIEFEWLAAEPLHSPTGVAVAIENFRDVAHFPFVHHVSMGPTPQVVEPLKVRREGLDVVMERPLDAGEGEWANDGDCIMFYHCAAPGLASITYDYERLGKRIVAGFPSPMAYDDVKIFWGVANARDFTGADLQENLRIEEMVYLEDMPIAAGIYPREIDWDGVFVEHSVPADLFTLNYRRAFREFMERAVPEVVAVPQGQRGVA